ncbi:YkvA family protein [Sphaerotilus sp.]|jgi:uncharacterized membrane protein YkvA (DUF1232 family)|uniref:YkvA family protein n=1 Tax=Sphaerotilus sp. TaxID=2093942 RepID=UPI0025DC8745|nr:YkvA family protein [Sphaerotilus sp.]
MWKRVAVVWTLVKVDARVLWYALQHPQSPRWLKVGVVGMVAYLLSPIDLIPDVIPVIGVVDDLVLIPLAMRWLLKRLPAAIRDYAERRARGESVDKADRPTVVRVVD